MEEGQVGGSHGHNGAECLNAHGGGEDPGEHGEPRHLRDGRLDGRAGLTRRHLQWNGRVKVDQSKGI